MRTNRNRGLSKTDTLLTYDPHQLLEGAAICALATRVDAVFIFIRGEYHLQARILERGYQRGRIPTGFFGSQGVLGTGQQIECYVHRGGPALMFAGEETGLLESLEGKRGWPRK